MSDPAALFGVGDDRFSRLSIFGQRLGAVSEIVSFLSDLERAYRSLVVFDAWELDLRQYRRYIPTRRIEMPSELRWKTTYESQRLELSKIAFSSPGAWEVIGLLNPLGQIRAYLNERHERRKDHEYRESAEARKLELENRTREIDLEERELRLFQRKIEVMLAAGLSKQQVRREVHEAVGADLRRLASHQDSGLIASAELEFDPDTRW